MTHESIISIILGIVGIASIAGGSIAYFSKGRADGVLELQDKEIQLLREDNKRLTKLSDENTKRIASLETEIKLLRNIATQAPQIRELAEKTAEQHKEVLLKLTEIAQNTGPGQ
jgi:hypothetical protein